MELNKASSARRNWRLRINPQRGQVTEVSKQTWHPDLETLALWVRSRLATPTTTAPGRAVLRVQKHLSSGCVKCRREVAWLEKGSNLISLAAVWT